MAHSIKELGTDRRGNFVRNLGWKLADGGRRTQPRFYLGKDRHEARRRNERLQELWGVIENEADVSQAAIWSATTLEIAKAIAEGRSSCELSPPLPINDGDDVLAYTKLVDDYAKKFRMIAILPGDMNAYQQGQALFGDRKKEVVRLGAKVFGEPNILEAETRTLHEALDDYIEFVKAAFIDIESRKTSGWGNTQAKEAARLKEKHANIPLSRLDLPTIEGMINLWRNRPIVKKKADPITAKTAENHIKRLKNFLWWLHRQQTYRWQIPPEVDRLPTKVSETEREIQRRVRPNQVETYSVDELTKMYKYATPIERAYILLGLNCGFAVAEFGSLRLNQVFLRQRHGYDNLVGYVSTPGQSWIKRLRIKTKVYGEWLLWDETVQAIEWATNRRRKQPGYSDDAHLFLTDRGLPFVGQTKGGNNSSRISKLWYRGLLDRVCKDDLLFRRLGPKSLRKTSGDMIRDIADGEIMAVFHCRGQAVKTDHLADVYSNRPFGKVFRAIEQMHERLKSMFDSVPDPFPTEAKKGGPNISLGSIERIRSLDAAGWRPADIAKEVGVSASTVYRHIKV